MAEANSNENDRANPARAASICELPTIKMATAEVKPAPIIDNRKPSPIAVSSAPSDMIGALVISSKLTAIENK
jgi:hypothetical protein